MTRPRRLTAREWLAAEASWMPLWLAAIAAAYLLRLVLPWLDGPP